MDVPLQRRLKGWLPNMHGHHPELVVGPRIIFSTAAGLLIVNHTCAGATPLECPTETACAVAVRHYNGVAQT